MTRDDPIDFTEENGVYTGVGDGGRTWTIARSLTGWRLEFRDKGDTTRTNAGNHHTLEAAQAEAGR